jgi:membrane-associated phospholipid phosphatase
VLDKLVKAIAQPAVLLVASAVAAAAVRHRRAEVARFVIAVPLTAWVVKKVKKAAGEPRPRLDDKHPFESFPSGHCAATTAFLVSLVLSKRAWWSVPLAATAITIVSISRVTSRDHWPIDAVAGDAFGLAGALVGEAAARVVA